MSRFNPQTNYTFGNLCQRDQRNHDRQTSLAIFKPIYQDSRYFSHKCHRREMETYLLLPLLFMYLLFRYLHYSYLRNLFAQTLKGGLSLSLSVCISFHQAPEPTCDVEKFMGGPNAPARHAFINDRLIPSRVVHSHDAIAMQWLNLEDISYRFKCTSSNMLQPAEHIVSTW